MTECRRAQDAPHDSLGQFPFGNTFLRDIHDISNALAGPWLVSIADVRAIQIESSLIVSSVHL
jgi:hypothetical protein